MNPYSRRVTEHYANAAYCRLAGGADVEQHLARAIAHGLPEHVTQLDHLCRSAPPSPQSLQWLPLPTHAASAASAAVRPRRRRSERPRSAKRRRGSGTEQILG